MKITHGLLAGQVLQRNRANKGGARITGTCSSQGNVELRVLKGSKALPGHNWKSIGIAEAKSFTAALSDLRTGGPYTIELRIKTGRKICESMSVDNVFVGDVWILAGQSNMEGVGNLEHAPKANPKVRAFYMRDEWDVAEEPIHYLGEAVDSFHNEYGDGPKRPSARVLAKRRAGFVKGMSPGHAFGLEMLKRTNVPQGLVACAHGGTSMAQWSPELCDQGGASLYGAMMRRYRKLGQEVAGLLWYQGESDANYEAAEIYTDKMIELIDATRRDMKLPRLPWFVVQLGCHAATEDGKPWNSVQEQQRLLPEVVKHIDIAPAVDLELDDGIHIGGKGHLILGRRLARLADRMIFKARGVKPGLTLKKMELIKTPGDRPEAACTSVLITYGNVAGRLISDGRPTGFSLINDKGIDIKGIYKTSVKGCTVTLHTNMSKYQLEQYSVSYGHGRYPMCNVTDADGMSIPVMQAIPVNPESVPFCDNWQVAFIPAVKTLARASLAKTKAARGWTNAHPRNPFGVLPTAPGVDRTGVFAFRTTVKAVEDLDALLIFGANAPFKVWINGKVVLSDPKATLPIDNPIYREKLHLKKGKNTLLVAYHTDNAAQHIGLWARIGTLAEKLEPRISW